jgi:hypothetical protein
LAGNITSISVDLEQGSGKPVVFRRTDRAKETSGTDLQKFVGDYQLGGSMTLKVYTKGPRILYLAVPGQPEYELVMVDTNKFSIKTLTGFTIQFNVNAAGDVTELLSIQPNGTFKATKKK